jgi:putative ABC transport system permease protein
MESSNMTFNLQVRESLRNLFSSKLRALLAILGVLVGTAAVVALMASSRLATDHALAQFKTLGTNLLALDFRDKGHALAKENQPVFQLSQMRQVYQSSQQIALAAPYVNVFQPVSAFSENLSGQVVGTTEAMQRIVKIHMDAGRFISDLDGYQRYCVIGASIAQQYYQRHLNPVGRQIRVGAHFFTIVGVATPWKPNLFLLADLNKAVIVPLKATYLLQKAVKIHDILFRLAQPVKIAATQAQITTAFQHILPHQSLQFRNPQQIIELVGSQRQTFSRLLIAIGSIALVVGGIGVMNIMLVSVVERRREIGIRRAIGAQQKDILMMFLIESVLLTVFGGVLGILLGLGVTYSLAHVAGWGFHFYLMPPLLGFMVSVLSGVISGFYPAWRASKLDPIACLTV